MLKSIELFAGAGGLGMGISRAGFFPLDVIEWDRNCCNTIRRNKARKIYPVSRWPLHEGDVRGMDFTRYEGKVALVSGGPPCQPFSLGGKHRSHEDTRDMWSEAVRAVRESKPKAFIFENVKGLTRSTFASYLSYINLQLTYPEIVKRNGQTWPEHLARLERHHTSSPHNGLTYNVICSVLNAANYGVPQRRERVFFVGFRTDQSIAWNFPSETHSLEALLWDQCRTDEYWERHKVSRRSRVLNERLRTRGETLLLQPETAPWRTVRDAIGDLPDPETSSLAACAILNHKFQPGARVYHGHTGSPLDESAKTLKAGVHGVPGGENMLMRSDGSFRYFTVRESARLQMFPDGFGFEGSWSEAMRQLGNAVPVGLAEILARSIAARLEARSRANA